MKSKQIAIWAGTGTLAFLVGFGAVVLVAKTAAAMTQTSTETNMLERGTEVGTIKTSATPITESTPGAEIVDEWPTPAETSEISGGMYYADDFNPPWQFRYVESLTFEMYDYEKQLEDGTYGVPIPPKGTIRIGRTSYKLTRIAVGKGMIGFQTEERGGVSYRFTGKFNNFDYCETEEEVPDIVGRMIRIENGKWAAEAEMSFFSEGCGC